MQTMSSSTSRATATALAQVQALIAGTQKHFVNTSFTLAGTSYTSATLVQTLTSLANAPSAFLSAHAGVKAALTALANVEASVRPVEQAYRRVVVAAYASSPQELADFGVPAPRARAPRTQRAECGSRGEGKAHPRSARHHEQEAEARGEGRRFGGEHHPRHHPCGPGAFASCTAGAERTGHASQGVTGGLGASSSRPRLPGRGGRSGAYPGSREAPPRRAVALPGAHSSYCHRSAGGGCRSVGGKPRGGAREEDGEGVMSTREPNEVWTALVEEADDAPALAPPTASPRSPPSAAPSTPCSGPGPIASTRTAPRPPP